MPSVHEIEIVAVTGDADRKIENTKEKLDELGDSAKKASEVASDGLKDTAEKAKDLAEDTKGVTKQMVFVAKSAKKAGLAMKTALIATGIGAFVVLLGTVVAYWDDIKGFVTGVNVELQRQIRLQEKLADEQEHSLKLLNASDNVLKLQGKSQKEINDLKQEEISKLITIQTKELELQKARLANLQAIRSGATSGLEGFFRTGSTILTLFAEKIDQAFGFLGFDTGFAQASFSLSDTVIESIFGTKEDLDETEKSIKELELSLANLKNTSAGITLSERVNPEPREKQKRAGLGLAGGKDDRIQKLRDELQELADIDGQFLIEQVEREREAAAQRIQIEREVAEAKRAILESNLDNVQRGLNLLTMLNRKSNLLQAAALVGESAAGIAKIVVQTQSANAAAKLKYALIPGGQALAAAEILTNKVSAGLGIAANIAATAKALSALKAGGAPSGGGSLGGDGGGSSAPQFNLIRGTDSNQIAEGIQGQQRPIKAFVVGQEMTTQQEMDRRIASDSTI